MCVVDMLQAPGHARIVYALGREGWRASVCHISCMLLNLCNSSALTRTFWEKPTLRTVRWTSGSRTVIRKSMAHAIRCDERDTTLRGSTRSCSCSPEVTVAEVSDHYRFTKLGHVEGNEPEGVRIKRVMSESVGGTDRESLTRMQRAETATLKCYRTTAFPIFYTSHLSNFMQ